MGEFNGKVVLITGASSGIGAETALHFAAEGAGLALVGRDEGRLEKSAKDCMVKGLAKDKVLTIKADMCVEDDVKRIVESTITHFGRLDVLVSLVLYSNSQESIQSRSLVLKRIVESTITHFGRLDVLVNNAGGSIPCFLTSEDLMKNYDRIVKLNVRSVIQLTNLATTHLIASKGSVVNVSSVCGKRVMAGMLLPYNISKAAVDQFTRCAALELASKGVRVNAVNPGTIMTPIKLKYGKSEEEVRERASKTHPMGRAGESNEVAPAIKFLASNVASFITGETLSIDGGRHVGCAR